jgi:hypothetical protein
MTNLADISGIAETYAQKLHAAGVPTVEALLEKGGHARRSGADRESQWYRARADPHLGQPRRSVSHPRRRRRVCGAARGERRRYGPGTRSTQPRAPDEKMGQVNQQKSLVRLLPTEQQVAGWIQDAKALPRAVTH